MIKIINGTFGYRQGSRVIPLTSKSGAVELPKELEVRLVKEGVAEYVNTEVKPQQAKEEKPSKPKYDREFLIARYKELELPGNPVQLKNEVLAEEVAKAEANISQNGEPSTINDTNTNLTNEGEVQPQQPQIETTEVGKVNPEGLIPANGQDDNAPQNGEGPIIGDANDNPATGEGKTQTNDGNDNENDVAPVLTEDDGIVE